jgi:hypothetical protein
VLFSDQNIDPYCLVLAVFFSSFFLECLLPYIRVGGMKSFEPAGEIYFFVWKSPWICVILYFLVGTRDQWQSQL